MAANPEGESFDYKTELEKMCKKLGVQLPLDSECIALKEEALKYLNGFRYGHRKSFLTKCAELGIEEGVEFCLRFDGLAINSGDRNDTAGHCAWRNKHYGCLLRLLRKDSQFPHGMDASEIDDKCIGAKELREFIGSRVELHESIRDGDLETVKNITKYESSSLYLRPDNQTAVYSAIEHKQVETYCHLISVGAKPCSKDHFDGEEEKEFCLRCDELCEFFSCNYLSKYSGTGKMDGRKLKTIFTDKRYDAILRFFDAAMKKSDFRDRAVNAKLDNWNATDVLEGAFERADNGDLIGMHFLRCLLEMRSSLIDFIQVIRNHEKRFYYDRDVCKLLLTCMNDDVCYEMFDSEFILKSEFTASVFIRSDYESVRDLLERLRREHSSRRHGDTGHSPPQIHSTVRVTQLVGVEGGKEGKGMRFMDVWDSLGRNTLFIAGMNQNGMVLTELILFFVDIAGKERTKGLLLQRDSNNYTIISYISSYVRINLTNLLRDIASVSDKETVVELLKEKDPNFGCKYIHYFGLSRSCDEYDELMDWLIQLCGGELPEQLKLELYSYGMNIWHYAANYIEDFGSVFRNLKKWWQQLSSGEEFKNEITRCNDVGDTVFHRRAFRGYYPLRDLNELETILGREDFVKLMTKEDKRKENCLHVSFRFQPPEIISDDLNYLKEFLNGDHLIEFITARDEDGDTLLHRLRKDDGKVKDVVTQMKGILGESNFRKLVETRNSEGRKVEIVYEGDECYVKWET